MHRNILSDQIIELEGFYSHQKYPGALRRVEVWDEENEKVIVLLTNHMTFGSTTICRDIQGSVADRDLFQNHQTESEDQDLCGNLSECAFDPDLDSIDCGPDSEVPEVPVQLSVVAIQSGGDVAIQPVHLQGFMDMD